MQRSLLLSLLLSIALVSSASAVAPAAPGVNLRWDACYSDGGVWNKSFACNVNFGGEQLVGSFELVQPLPRVNSVQFVVDLVAASPALPAWWSLAYSGGCRSATLDFSTAMFPAPTICVDWARFPSGGALSAYAIGGQGPASARVSGVVANSGPPYDMSPGIEYFAFRLLINHAKTVGAGSCSGCDVPVCLFLSRISVYQLGNSVPSIQLDHGANWLGSQYATWQNGYPLNVHEECDPVLPDCSRQFTAFGCALASPTSQRKSTWGQVKALYR